MFNDTIIMIYLLLLKLPARQVPAVREAAGACRLAALL